MIPNVTCALSFLAAAVSCCGATPPRLSDAPPVPIRSSDAHYTFDGWGTSLCWFANAVGRWPDAERTQLADALFSPAGLGLTVVRYNIGGGENPAHHHMPSFRQMDGFEPQPGKWDWTADPGQRWMLAAAIARGANRLEAFSNSPPYWMTLSQCASGGTDPNVDNLDPKFEDAFAAYLVDVVQHFQATWGVRFQTLDPFNEPFTDYWKMNGRQEGDHFDRTSQARMIQRLRRMLDAHGLKDVAISASDETNYERAIGTFGAFDEATRACVGRINAHAYATDGRTELRALAASAAKPLVMSEVDGPGGTAHAHDSMLPALELGGRIVDDLRGLHPLQWVFWQAVEDESGQAKGNKNWGLIHADLAGTTHQWTYTKKYYAMAQFSKYIRPGATILSGADDQTIIAYRASDRRLVIVIRNATTEERTARYDVNDLGARIVSAHAYRTSAGENLAEISGLSLADGIVLIKAEPQSITTYVLQLAPPTM